MARVVFLHPDLGIGGAERLVVDAALALKARGFEVKILTAHHDPTHCFAETSDGQLEVIAVGDWLPRCVFGRCQALFASLRMIYITLYLMFFISCDVVIVDQVSTPLPLLFFLDYPTLFYCHFPDLLLTSGRTGFKALYRYPLDWFEEYSTGFADVIFVNSGFTKKVFRSTFPRLEKSDPIILYPSLSTRIFEEDGSKPSNLLSKPKSFFLSINRYERKKNLQLAIQSFGQLSPEDRRETRLVMVGGYDSRVEENVEYYTELNHLVSELDLQDEVEFLKSPSDAEKVWLLKNALCLVYTPTNEHFGIVPLESMYCLTPVIAVNSGGPTETIVNSVTGWLREPNVEEFSKAMQGVLDNREHLQGVGMEGKNRVKQFFSFNSFGEKLESSIFEVVSKRRESRSFLTSLAVAFHFCLALGILYWMIFGMPVP
jgi:alpha-1,3/alpha-1,6-mannosyltransferase